MFKRIADWAVMCPSTHSIPVEGKERRVVDSEYGPFEAWVERTGDEASPELFILKFLGTGGRAERSTVHPAECWSEVSSEIWSINPPGYGGSAGRASIQKIPEIARAAYFSIKEAAKEKPVLVTGNSMGTAAALYLAARHDVDGV